MINMAVVIYLLRAKRLFGMRGGLAAEQAENALDQGWQALERAPRRRHARSAPASPAT